MGGGNIVFINDIKICKCDANVTCSMLLFANKTERKDAMKRWVMHGIIVMMGVFLVACGGGGGSSTPSTGGTSSGGTTSGGNNPPPVVTQGANQAILGTLVDAEVKVYKLDDLEHVVTQTVTGSATGDLNKSGRFDLNLSMLPTQTWVVVSVRGGKDIDADDDGIMDLNPTTNLGTIHAIAQVRDLRAGLNVNVLTEIAWQTLYAKIKAHEYNTTQMQEAMEWVSAGIIDEDIDGDGVVNYKDLLAFNPQKQIHKAKLRFNYTKLYSPTNNNLLINKIHNAKPIASTLESLFGTMLNMPEAPKMVSFEVNVSLPKNNLDINATALRVSSFVSDTKEITDEIPQVVMAEDDANRTLLLGYAIPKASLRAVGIVNSSRVARVASTQKVELSMRSTALALVMLHVAANLDAKVKTEVADFVLKDGNFTQLVDDINTSFSANPYFLDELMLHEDIVSQIKKVGNNALKSYLDSLHLGLDTTQITQLFDVNATRNPSSLRSFNVRAVAGQRVEDNFWSLSPWRSRTPWLWYWDGSATYNIVDAPFIATSESSSGVMAIGNPTHINYMMETYSDKGEFIDWYVVPRCSTLVQKALYSGVAYKEFRFNDLNIKGKKVAFIEMHKYLIDGEWNDRHYGILALNTLHLVSGILSAVADGTVLEKMSKVLESKSKLKRMEKAGILLSKTMVSMASTVDYSKNQSMGAFLSKNFSSISEIIVTEVLADIETSLSTSLSKSMVKMNAKLAAKTSSPAGWVMIVADSLNDFIPFSVSLLAGQQYAGYAISHNTNAITDVTRTDKRPDGSGQSEAGSVAPIAMFSVKQTTGMSVEFDASASKFDTKANPSFEWGFGDGTTGSGQKVTHTYSAVGEYAIELRVYDGLGQSHKVQAKVHVTNGTPPVVKSLECRMKNMGASGKTVWLTYEIEDADNDMKTVAIYKAGSTQADKTVSYDSNEAFFYFQKPSVTDIYALKVKFIDAGGNVAVGACSVHDTNNSSQESNETTINLDDGLVAYYEFEGDANDSSGNGNNGTEYGGVAYADGVIGKAAKFDGVDDYLDLGNFTYMKNNEEFSVSFWTKFSSGQNSRIIAQYDVDSNSRAWQVATRTDKLAVYLAHTGTTLTVKVANTVDTYTDGKWHNVILNWSNGTINLYIDNQLATLSYTSNPSFTTITNHNANLTISNDANTADRFQGLLDEVKIYNRALNEAEIQKLYKMGNEYNQEANTSSNSITFHSLKYQTIVSPKTGRVWLDRNIGASEVCIGNNNKKCTGTYMKWGQVNIFDSTRSIRIQDTSNVGYAIVPDWMPEDKDGTIRTELWNKTDGSGICPIGFRVPTLDEYKAEMTDNQIIKSLKLPNTLIWSNTVGPDINAWGYYPAAYTIKINNENIEIVNLSRGGNTSNVRCVRDND